MIWIIVIVIFLVIVYFAYRWGKDELYIKSIIEMEKELKIIIDEHGYSEMADGFENAMNILSKHYFGSKS